MDSIRLSTDDDQNTHKINITSEHNTHKKKRKINKISSNDKIELYAKLFVSLCVRVRDIEK